MRIKNSCYANVAVFLGMAFGISGCVTAPLVTPVKVKELSAPKIVAETVYQGGLFSWPADGDVISTFGSKIGRVINKGIDIRVKEGSSVRAAKAGRVIYCDPKLRGYGKTVIIDHGGGFQTVYAYNSEIITNVGTQVKKNDVIALCGSTGRSSGPTLHFEIRRNGEPEDPVRYLGRIEYAKRAGHRR
jgi:murein DD-endopeptidase MepM/ murein hydrolase activator NlpD